MESGKTCKICRFSIIVPFGDKIECHKHAPSPWVGENDRSGASWPVLQRDSWCGDWELKDKEDGE